jgi:hypothetical protein
MNSAQRALATVIDLVNTTSAGCRPRAWPEGSPWGRAWWCAPPPLRRRGSDGPGGTRTNEGPYIQSRFPGRLDLDDENGWAALGTPPWLPWLGRGVVAGHGGPPLRLPSVGGEGRRRSRRLGLTASVLCYTLRCSTK